VLHLITFSDTHTYTLGWILWMGIGPSQRPLPVQHTTFTTGKTSMPRVGFEPVIPACRRPQTHALDHAATGIGLLSSCYFFISFFCFFTCLLVVIRMNWQSSVRADIRNRNLRPHSVNDFPDILLIFSQPSTSRTGGNKIEALRPQHVITVHLLRHRTETEGIIITSPVIPSAKFHLLQDNDTEFLKKTLHFVPSTLPVTYRSVVMRHGKCLNAKFKVKITEQREERKDMK